MKDSGGVWRQAAFVRFFAGACVSVIGNWFNNVAVAVVTYRLTGQISFVALALGASVLPRALLSPFGGMLADRFERRRLLVAIDVGRTFAALLPLLAHDVRSLWAIYLSAVLLQLGATISNPGQSAYLPQLVPDRLLEPSNAIFASMRDIGMFVGPALATLVIGLWGAPAAFIGNALSFAVSAGMLLTLPKAVASARSNAGPLALLVGYRRIVRCYPQIAALYVCYIGTSAGVYFFLAIIVAYARLIGQPSTFIGLLYAAAGLGGACGGLAMGKYLSKLPYKVALAIYSLTVPLVGVISFVHVAALALVLFAISTAAGTAGDVIVFVSVQRIVRSDERGRAFGLLYWSIALGQLIGAALATTVTLSTLFAALLWMSIGVWPLILGGMLLSIRADHLRVVTPLGVAAEG